MSKANNSIFCDRCYKLLKPLYAEGEEATAADILGKHRHLLCDECIKVLEKSNESTKQQG